MKVTRSLAAILILAALLAPGTAPADPPSDGCGAFWLVVGACTFPHTGISPHVGTVEMFPAASGEIVLFDPNGGLVASCGAISSPCSSSGTYSGPGGTFTCVVSGLGGNYACTVT